MTSGVPATSQAPRGRSPGHQALSLGVRSLLLSPETIIFAALFVRVVFVVAGHQYRFPTAGDHWGFGWETGRIARSIAIGHGFASPFQPRETGPTSFLPPLYPYLVAGVFRVFGVYSNASGLVLLLINSIAGAITAGLIYFIAIEFAGDLRVAALSGWIWTLFPLTIWPVRWVWETSISTALLTLIVLVTLRRRNMRSFAPWVILGGLWGIAALANMSLVSVLPFSLVWLIDKERNQGWLPWKHALLTTVIVFAVCLPWTVRNALTFHRFIFVRGGAAVTFRDGNGPEGNGAWIGRKDPSNNTEELASYVQLGEAGYTDLMRAQGRDFVRQHPVEYVVFCIRRVFYFWGGPPDDRPSASTDFRNWIGLTFSAAAFVGLFVAIYRRMNGSALFALILGSYPFTFYLVLVFFRYRHPIEPEMVVMCAYLAHSVLSTRHPINPRAHAPANKVGGTDGVHLYGSASEFRVNSFSAIQLIVDVVFDPFCTPTHGPMKPGKQLKP